jgi:hypothetical protein
MHTFAFTHMWKWARFKSNIHASMHPSVDTKVHASPWGSILVSSMCTKGCMYTSIAFGMYLYACLQADTHTHTHTHTNAQLLTSASSFLRFLEAPPVLSVEGIHGFVYLYTQMCMCTNIRHLVNIDKFTLQHVCIYACMYVVWIWSIGI